MRKIEVMIIEDDFRIAKIHQEMIEQNSTFNVVQRCLTAKDALAFLAKVDRLPSVILLDMYIPDVQGLELLETLKRTYPYIAIIIASAADDIETFRQAKLLGVFDYMIKPIEQERLQESFQKYVDLINYKTTTITQEEIDLYFRQVTSSIKRIKEQEVATTLPKGIDTLTLEKIKIFLEKYDDTAITAQTLGEMIGISRSTARRYLEYLGKLGIVTATLHYGQVGRPQRIYKMDEQYEQN